MNPGTDPNDALDRLHRAGWTVGEVCCGNTLIVSLSDASAAHHSRCWEWPMMAISDRNGKLKGAGTSTTPAVATRATPR
jgi:hypothetical protein